MPTYVITGCSSGIGLDLTKALAARGDKVFALVRSRSGSQSGEDAISEVEGDVTVIEGIDVASDDVGEALAASSLAGETIDCLINNAGISGAGGNFAAQKLDKITMDLMRETFEINTLGPLRVTQALMGQMASPGGKVVVISTGIGSIGDNTSGGMYAYRSSKAAVNMVSKSLAADLQKDGKEISVAAIAPGFVATYFAGSVEKMQGWGAKPVRQATEGILRTIDDMTVENTGRFIMVPTDGGAPKEYPW
uniref:Short-chain dehydrogenase n=1 Tax=Odontella aurita TaxID=265563 RepID=A0A7S4JZQ3_9STRA|mmetsp:Transcript_58057/g.173273  ORF Transcript_58057/g.173273 Transcript_58057/m.173273 type:complete len:250 (+) Transcript_58057:136-885(+)